MARFLLAAGFNKVVGHDLQPDRDGLARAHRLAHAGLREEVREARLEALMRGLWETHLGGEYLAGVEDSSLVVPTQAWFLQPANRVLHELRAIGLPFYSLVQAYLDLSLGTVIGVTGSHGKSTTSALVAAALAKAAIFPTVWLAGNDRHNQQALEEVARDTEGRGCLVLEISNRQLLQMDRAPEIAAITNITPNHLDEHGGLSGYVACKRRIIDLPGCRAAVRNADDPISVSTGAVPPTVRELRFSVLESHLGNCDGAFEANGQLLMRRAGASAAVLELEHLRLRGEHNRANVRAAAAICCALGSRVAGEEGRLGEGLTHFGTLSHRIQLIWQDNGVDYYDDLSSTTPQSTVAAIRTVGRKLALICGGQDKGISFEQLAQEVGQSVGTVVLLPGTGSERIWEAIRALGQEDLVFRAQSLDESVKTARRRVQPGEAILLSPACPGFFTANYGQGGFRSVVRRLSTSPRPRMRPE